MRKVALLTLTTAFAVAALVVPSPVGAKPPTPKATGGVELSGPMQYLEFNAFDVGSASDRGNVSYTNFEAEVTGSGVWDVSDLAALVFNFEGIDYGHVVTSLTIDPTSPTSTQFSGTGAYVPNGTEWTIEGQVTGSDISYEIVYTAGPLVPNPGYSVQGSGTISAEDGSMSGTAVGSFGDALLWTAPPGSASEVFHYTAPVTCAKVTGDTAWFSYVVPADAPIAANTPLTFQVIDGGSPGAGVDTAGFSVSTDCDSSPAPTNSYPVVDGNLAVH